MRFLITVGDGLETARAEDKKKARAVATKLAFKYKGVCVVGRDVVNGTTAFAFIAPRDCPACQD